MRRLLSVAAIATFAALPLLAQPPGGRPTAPEPKGSLAGLFSKDDYPRSALAAGQQGPVEAELLVGPHGRVVECAIIGGTPSPALQSTTCRLLRARARFVPARDAKGQAVPARQKVHLLWTLPGPEAARPVVSGGLLAGWAPTVGIAPPASALARGPAAEPPRSKVDLPRLFGDLDYPASALRAGEEGRVDFVVTVAENGRVERCDIVRSSGSAALDSTTCRIARARARFAPALDAAGNPTTATHRGSVNWRLPAPPPPPEPEAGPARQ
jgi:TonB family protein